MCSRSKCILDPIPIAPLIVAMVGDTKAKTEAKKYLKNIKHENPDIFEFV
jgi:hypothetical protein